MTGAQPSPPFRSGQPTAWTFHRATARWSFSTIEPGSSALLPGREDPSASWVPLPPPADPGVPLWSAVRERVSCRAFTEDGLTLPQLATLLYAGYGMQGRSSNPQLEVIDRTVPSAGGLYPLELSVIVRSVDGLEPGVYHFVPMAHGLEVMREGAIPATYIRYLFMGQPWVAEAAIVVVLSAVPQRSLSKYGDRGYRYLLIEAGHVTQVLNLVAGGLGLGAVNVGGFFDDELAGLIRADPEEEIPLYACAVGTPTTEDRMGKRAIPSD